MVGVYLPPMASGRKHLDCPDFHPLYQRVQELDLPFVVHIGVARPPPKGPAHIKRGTLNWLRRRVNP